MFYYFKGIVTCFWELSEKTKTFKSEKLKKHIPNHLTWGWWQINIWKVISEVFNMSYSEWRTTFTDFDFNSLTRDKKNMIFYKVKQFLTLWP